ncbi:MAG: hypothetical protein H0W96_03055 [Solirubrobacterales bacterium]|nr:hypothetical protein [Solirubrobacterales bacterium]
MSNDVPMMCSLSAGDLRVRLAEMADLGRTALQTTRIEPLQAQLRFAAGAGVRDRVDAIVVAEAQCCSFLEMRATAEPDTVVLTIDARAGAEVVLAGLVDAFRGEPPTS